MSRLYKSFKALSKIVRNPWLLNRILEENEQWQNIVRQEYRLENGFPVIHPQELFGDFTETVQPFAFLDGGSLPTDLALLKRLARRIHDCNYFEIGTWRGESAANVASVAKKCTTLNLSAAEMESLRLHPRYIEQHGIFSRNLDNVIHLEGNSKTFNFSGLDEKFDLVFIDGDHHYEMVRNDTVKVFENLVHENSIVVWHDYAKNPESVRFEIMAGILAGTPAWLYPDIFHIAHTLCAVYLPGKHEGRPLDPPVRPSGTFKVNIEYHGLTNL